jgi:hypothetical protein
MLDGARESDLPDDFLPLPGIIKGTTETFYRQGAI